MKSKKLIINFNSTKNYDNDDTTKVITFGELVSLVKSKTIYKSFFKYKEVVFKASRLNAIPWPFLITGLVRLLSKGKGFFEDDQGNVMKVSISLFIKNLIQLIKDYFKKDHFLQEVEKEIDSLLNENRNNQGVKLNLKHRPVYLRTDMWFGVSAGGSVGHIAGVLNNLDGFSGNPIFLSSDIIPTVRNDIEKKYILPSNAFRDFKELNSIVYNTVFFNDAVTYLNGKDLSFIYQRYSLNNFSGVKLAKKYNVPFILEYNGSEVWISRNWGGKPLKYESLSEKIEELNLLYADEIVVVSQPMKDELVNRGIDEKKILVNPNGVDPQKYSPDIVDDQLKKKLQLENKVVLGFIGTFGMWHGAEVLAEAFGELLTEDSQYKDNIRLLMIGNGVTMPKVREELRKYNVEGCSILTGIISQNLGPSYLSTCDILVSPHVPNKDGSPFFGSPTKLFEYMAMGKGIVASDLGQIGEILDHHKTAFMVTPGEVKELVNALKELIENRELRRYLGEEARKKVVESYTWEKHTSNIIQKLVETVECLE